MCSRGGMGLRNAEFLKKVTNYDAIEGGLHSTQKQVETEYKQIEFWNHVKAYHLIRIN